MVMSASVRVAGPTTPVRFVASSKKTNDELSARTAVAYTNAFRASRRGVSRRDALQALSWPSSVTALTAKHRETPFVKLPAKNPSDAVDPSRTQLAVHTPRVASYAVE